MEEKRNAYKWKVKEGLILAKEWASKTVNVIQKYDTICNGIEKYFREVHGMYRSTDSIRCKWILPFTSYRQMWNYCYNQVFEMDRNDSGQKKSLVKMAHAIYLNRKIRKKRPIRGLELVSIL